MLTDLESAQLRRLEGVHLERRIVQVIDQKIRSGGGRDPGGPLPCEKDPLDPVFQQGLFE